MISTPLHILLRGAISKDVIVTPIIRPECPEYLLPYLANDPSEWELHPKVDEHGGKPPNDILRKFALG